MATTVTIETDKHLPPQGSSRRNRLVAEMQSVIQQELGDSSVVVHIVKRK